MIMHQSSLVFCDQISHQKGLLKSVAMQSVNINN
jgi:hypothetical protein